VDGHLQAVIELAEIRIAGHVALVDLRIETADRPAISIGDSRKRQQEQYPQLRQPPPPSRRGHGPRLDIEAGGRKTEARPVHRHRVAIAFLAAGQGDDVGNQQLKMTQAARLSRYGYDPGDFAMPGFDRVPAAGAA